MRAQTQPTSGVCAKQLSTCIHNPHHKQAFLSSKVACLQLRDEANELDELREMKADIERRERAQATVIENQAKRLDELETLYKVGMSVLGQ